MMGGVSKYQLSLPNTILIMTRDVSAAYCIRINFSTSWRYAKETLHPEIVISLNESDLPVVAINCRVLIIQVKLMISRFFSFFLKKSRFPLVNKVKNVVNQTLQ